MAAKMAEIPKVILLIETSREFGRGLLRGISKYSHLHGHWAFYREAPFYEEAGGLKRRLSRLKNWGADGIIMRENKMTEEIIGMGLPTIVSPHLLGQIKGLPNIVGDDTAIGKMGAEHLLDRGLCHFAFCGFDDMFWSRNRGESFGKRISKAGFKTHFYKQPRSKVQRLWENEPTIMADWLKSLPKPLGLMTCTDDRSQHIIEASKIAGLHVPEEVAIIGVDNDEMICNLTDPPLTSIVQNAERAGYEAAELLDKMMSGKKASRQTIKVEATHIVTRQSTDILAIEDRDVVEALRFIRQHSKKPIQVSEVVEQVAMSRRSLEYRFRKFLNRSVQEEIRRIRIERVIQMLVETNLPVSRIAMALNYPSIEHISRYFRKEKGMSPQAYRKKFGQK